MHVRKKLVGLIKSVWRENLHLNESGVVCMTWGNVSAIDRSTGLVAIKPSGVDYKRLRTGDIVLVDLKGNVVESKLKPSTDMPTHLALYRAFPEIGGVVHTHSRNATAFAQACCSLPCLGTTHADYFYGEVPVTGPMRKADVRADYEVHTGDMIVRKLRQLKIKPLECPSIFVANHGPFSWGAGAALAVDNAIVLELVCEMALLTSLLPGRIRPISKHLLDKHFLRKHGARSYYGQKK